MKLNTTVSRDNVISNITDRLSMKYHLTGRHTLLVICLRHEHIQQCVLKLLLVIHQNSIFNVILWTSVCNMLISFVKYRKILKQTRNNISQMKPQITKPNKTENVYRAAQNCWQNCNNPPTNHKAIVACLTYQHMLCSNTTQHNTTHQAVFIKL